MIKKHNVGLYTVIKKKKKKKKNIKKSETMLTGNVLNQDPK